MYSERRVACLRGWARRFWQGSTDHRGVPGAPGRVVTLTPLAGESCWGFAYRLDVGTASNALTDLDYREKGGYVRRDFKLETPTGASVTALTYFASADNPHYLGPAPLPDIARQIYYSAGPSGENIDYLLRLAETLRSINVSDSHVMQLEALVRRIEG